MRRDPVQRPASSRLCGDCGPRVRDEDALCRVGTPDWKGSLIVRDAHIGPFWLASQIRRISRLRPASAGNPIGHAARSSAANGTMTGAAKHRCWVLWLVYCERLSSRRRCEIGAAPVGRGKHMPAWLSARRDGSEQVCAALAQPGDQREVFNDARLPIPFAGELREREQAKVRPIISCRPPAHSVASAAGGQLPRLRAQCGRLALPLGQGAAWSQPGTAPGGRRH